MAISVENLLKERKYPFIFSLFTLLIIFTFLFVLNSQSPLNSTSDLTAQPLIKSIASTSSHRPPPPPAPTAISNPRKVPPWNATVSPDATTEVDDLKWRKCAGPGAVDYIPCLDNWKAIKALKSRRHMERRERHCPQPSPRCLVPLPQGYKVPVPWPKSKDMVR